MYIILLILTSQALALLFFILYYWQDNQLTHGMPERGDLHQILWAAIFWPVVLVMILQVFLEITKKSKSEQTDGE